MPETTEERERQATVASAALPEERKSPSRSSLIFVGIAALLFGASLVAPTLIFERREPLPGYQVFFWGWWGILAGSIAWYANVFLVFAARYYFKGYPGRAVVFGVAAILLAATSPFAKEWWFSEAAGTRIVGLGLGYKFWLASIAVFVGASIISAYGRTKT